MSAWEGLGYYSRARNLLQAARIVVEGGGTLPSTAAAWMALPGVGDYTSAAITSIAHCEAIPSVDGNVLRVFSRFWGIEENIARPATQKAIRDRLTPQIRKADPSAFNQAMMELGALVCRPRSPDCDACPLAPRCVARRKGLTQTIPVKGPAAKVPSYTEAVAVIRRRDKTLVCRRHEAGLLGGLWEFPGGRREGREPLATTLARGVLAQTGIALEDVRKRGRVTHVYSHFKLTLHVYTCTAPRGSARALAHAEVRWVSPSELAALPLSTAQRKVASLTIEK